MTEEKSAPAWKVVLAFFLDLFVSFFVIGYIVAALTGNLTDGGFEMNGAPALITFAVIIVYFVGMGKYAGGTVFQRLLKTRRS